MIVPRHRQSIWRSNNISVAKRKINTERPTMRGESPTAHNTNTNNFNNIATKHNNKHNNTTTTTKQQQQRNNNDNWRQIFNDNTYIIAPQQPPTTRSKPPQQQHQHTNTATSTTTPKQHQQHNNNTTTTTQQQRYNNINTTPTTQYQHNGHNISIPTLQQHNHNITSTTQRQQKTTTTTAQQQRRINTNKKRCVFTIPKCATTQLWFLYPRIIQQIGTDPHKSNTFPMSLFLCCIYFMQVSRAFLHRFVAPSPSPTQIAMSDQGQQCVHDTINLHGDDVEGSRYTEAAMNESKRIGVRISDVQMLCRTRVIHRCFVAYA